MTFKELVEYLKDNPKGYWFKRKVYGWGWIPATWCGWLILVIFVAFLLYNAFSLAENPTSKEITWFFVNVIISVGLLILICYWTGEKPKWQWGIKKEEIKEVVEKERENRSNG